MTLFENTLFENNLFETILIEIFLPETILSGADSDFTLKIRAPESENGENDV